ncbi:MAG: hypothetical protein KC416_02185 [Myxococcales bacterium]|nr:hypothetical protein [Myxococcales bacterium]
MTCLGIAHRWALPLLFLTIFVGSSTAMVTSASAQKGDSVKGEILVVLAKEEAGAFDEQLKEMAALKRPPFNIFKSMKTLSRSTMTMGVGKHTEVKLPNGRTIRVELEKVMPDGRYRVKVSINKPNKKDYLRLLQVMAAPGDPFFVAGQSHDGGTLVIGVRIGTKDETDPKAPDAP